MWIRYSANGADRFLSLNCAMSIGLEKVFDDRYIIEITQPGTWRIEVFAGTEEECKRVLNELFQGMLRGDQVHRISPNCQPEEESHGASRQVEKQFSLFEYVLGYILGRRGRAR